MKKKPSPKFLERIFWIAGDVKIIKKPRKLRPKR